jgi:hypothetical protein
MDLAFAIGGATLIGGLIVILSFVSDRPKRVEVQNMIDRSIASMAQGITRIEVTQTELRAGQKEATDALNDLTKNIANVCPYGALHKER